MKLQECGLDIPAISDLIDKWIFSERDRAILKRRLLDGVRYEALAEEFGLSVRQTKKIVYKGEERVLLHVAPWRF